MPKPPPKDVIRIDCLEKPEGVSRGDGLYEWRYLKQKYTLDFPDLIKDVEKLPGWETRGEEVATRLMNFPRVFIVIPTGELISDTIPTGEPQYPIDIPGW